MLKGMDDLQNLGKGNMDATVKSCEAMSKGYQAIAAEMLEYTKKSLDDYKAAVERLMSAKTMDQALAAQNDLAKAAYQDFMAHVNKMAALYVDAAKDSYKPFEGMLGTKVFEDLTRTPWERG